MLSFHYQKSNSITYLSRKLVPGFNRCILKGLNLFDLLCDTLGEID